jgi:hypothetical protein
MARSSSDIEAIIAGLKTARDTRDAAIETAAAALDGSDDKNAARLRSVNHASEKSIDSTICVNDKVKKDESGNIMAMFHSRYGLTDVVENGPSPVTVPGLTTLLVDESFTVTGATTVENL